MSQHEKKLTVRPVWPAKTQLSLYVYSEWQGFSFIPLWIAWRLYKAHAISEDWSDCGCAGWFWVFAGRRSLIVGFVVRWLNSSVRQTTFFLSSFYNCLQCSNQNKCSVCFCCFISVTHTKSHSQVKEISQRENWLKVKFVILCQWSLSNICLGWKWYSLTRLRSSNIKKSMTNIASLQTDKFCNYFVAIPFQQRQEKKGSPQRPISAYTPTRSDQRFRLPQKVLFCTIEYNEPEWKFWSDWKDVQADLGHRYSHLPGISPFFHGVASLWF